MFLSDQSRVDIYTHVIYTHIRGNRRTKNTFVAVESRSLTEFYACRVQAANPRFPPTLDALVGGNPLYLLADPHRDRFHHL